MRTARFSSSGGGGGGGLPNHLSPRGRPPSPGFRLPMDAGHVTCDACWEATPRGQTNTCENITLSQTSFAGGNDHGFVRSPWDVSLETVTLPWAMTS